ncbi:hypothetical protein [Spirillospora sp. NPDC048819]|uniref:hypothetical protein n=1 Tax=Spirillospora sp. NPDC048819 TaxID=3155268 RepID=UPI00341066D9
MPSAGAVWATLPRTQDVPLVDTDTDTELVGYRDSYPRNVVFRDGLPAALIDLLTRTAYDRIASIQRSQSSLEVA